MPNHEKPRYPDYTGNEPCALVADPDTSFFGSHDNIDNRRSSIPLDVVEAARYLCGGCPMLEPCMKWAVLFNERSGIWGGTTPEERKSIRRLSEWPDWDPGRRIWVLSINTRKEAS